MKRGMILSVLVVLWITSAAVAASEAAALNPLQGALIYTFEDDYPFWWIAPVGDRFLMSFEGGEYDPRIYVAPISTQGALGSVKLLGDLGYWHYLIGLGNRSALFYLQNYSTLRVRLLDSSGNAVGSDVTVCSGQEDITGLGMAGDSQGFVVAYSYPPNRTLNVRKFSINGTIQWTTALNTGAEGFEEGDALIALSENEVAVLWNYTEDYPFMSDHVRYSVLARSNGRAAWNDSRILASVDNNEWVDLLDDCSLIPSGNQFTFFTSAFDRTGTRVFIFGSNPRGDEMHWYSYNVGASFESVWTGSVFATLAWPGLSLLTTDSKGEPTQDPIPLPSEITEPELQWLKDRYYCFYRRRGESEKDLYMMSFTEEELASSFPTPTQTPTVTPTPTPIPRNMDLTDDGVVAWADLFLFSLQWQREGVGMTADADWDNDCDADDLLLFIESWHRLAPGTLTIALPGAVTMEMVRIPAGSFQMGRYPGEQDSDSDEDPQHPVTISQDFYLGKYELTKAQWEAVMGTTPWSGQSYVLDNPNSPAVFVSWNDAQAFITALNQLGQGTFRLPSEAEWEYACRAGTTTRFY